VRKQVAPVNQRVSNLETQTNEQIAQVSSKEQADISAVNERISSTDQRVAQVASAVAAAQGTASRAMDEANANNASAAANAAANSAAIAALGAGVANSLNYQLIEQADVTFEFNKSNLTPGAKVALDQIASKMQGLPVSVVELVGFTDQKGSPTYNLALSRRRAESVQRYLVSQKIAPRDIRIVGMGEEPAPANLSAANGAEAARRVHIRVFGAGDITQASAGK